MGRLKTFTVDAQEVQGGIAGATVTFKALKRSEWLKWRDDDSMTDADLVKSHVVSWTGFTDDAENELPTPSEDAAVMDELYMHEITALSKLLLQGPHGPDAQKN